MSARFSIRIEYDPQHMERSRKRLEARQDFGMVDRVPVLFCVERRYFLPLLGCGFHEFVKDVETHYDLQLQYNKYRIENVVEDFCLDESITVYPFFENMVNASGMGGDIHWSDNDPPRAVPVLKTVEDIDRLPDRVLDGGTVCPRKKKGRPSRHGADRARPRVLQHVPTDQLSSYTCVLSSSITGRSRVPLSAVMLTRKRASPGLAALHRIRYWIAWPGASDG